MSNVRHPQLKDTVLLKRLLINEGRTKSEVAKLLKVPYNCLTYQINQWPDEDKKRVKTTRHHYTDAEKKAIIKEYLAKKNAGESTVPITTKYRVQKHQLRTWAATFKAQREAVKPKST